MTIQVSIKSVYGRECVYPACDKAKLFAALAGQKTLSEAHLHLIKQLGYKIEQVPAYLLKGEVKL